jgi:hypothetical protein
LSLQAIPSERLIFFLVTELGQAVRKLGVRESVLRVGRVHGSACPARPPEMLMDLDAVHGKSSSDAKISLFRSLFRWRDDVYARRFER